MNEKIWHRIQKRWLEVEYYTPDDDWYYCVVKDPESEGETFAVARESVLFNPLRESISQEVQNSPSK